MTKTDEKVLCVDIASVRGIVEGSWSNDQKLAMLLKMKVYRNCHTPNDDGPDVEHDDRWKQMIPSIVVVNSKGQILTYNRGWKGGEDRLKGKWTCLFGGHVNNQDADWMAGVWREIREELSGADSVAYGYTAEQAPDSQILHGPVGFLNDDSDDVWRHHLGVVYVLRADEVTPRENPEFAWASVSLLELWEKHVHISMDGAELENWAVLALPMVREWMESEGK